MNVFIAAVLLLSYCFQVAFLLPYDHPTDDFSHEFMSDSSNEYSFLNTEKIGLDKSGQFIDSFGRIRLFRGLNFVKKGPPFYDEELRNSQHLQYYHDWGFNVIRLGCMWSGFYPQKDQLNLSHVMIMDEIINGLDKYGIYVLLDMHQDVISKRFNGYDGVPAWLVDMFPSVPKDLHFPWPMNESGKGSEWFKDYFAYEVGATFQNLYDNTTNSWGYWGQFWRKVADLFGTRKSVIGYELINEPWAGNIYLNPLRFIPGYVGRHNLLPVYDYLVQEIRKADPKTLIFYEPVTWGYYFPGGGYQGTGFDRLPGGNTEQSRSVMSYHYYCWLLQNISPESIYPHWDKVICDEIFAQTVFRSVREDQRLFKMGLFMTEFGGCLPKKQNETIDTIECHVMLNLLDENLQSWSYWDSSLFNASSGEPLWDAVPFFSRAYPRATAGQPIKLTFDHLTAEMVYLFTLNTSITAPTEIFLPIKVHYGGSFNNVNVTINPPDVLTQEFLQEESVLLLKYNAMEASKIEIPDESIVVEVHVKKL